MAKQAGMGDQLYVGGYDLSGDVGSLGSVAGGPAALEVTAIDKSGFERLGGLRNGQVEFSSFFNDAAGAAHPALSTRPITDRIVSYLRGTTLGNPAASMVAKQVNYDPSRGNDGSLTIAVQALANGYGLEWGRSLTAGKRTDSGATNGSSIDTTASASFGAQAYLQVFSFSGTDVTVKIQDSADNSSFADVASLAFTQVTGGAPLAERIAIGNTATVRRYLRAITVTTGGFSSLVFAVVVVKNETAGQVF
jgi:hypothetical protein